MVDFIQITKTVIRDVDTFAKLKEYSVFSKGGEVVVPSSGETQEDIVRASVIEKEKIILGGDLNIVTPKDSLNSTFLALRISNGKVYRNLVKKAQGKSVVHIRNSDLQETLILYPKNKTEQTQIGDFFQNLDQLITQHHHKLTKLKTLKKAMLDKMFPKDGATVPEIRFKEFTGDWNENKLGQVSKITTGSSNREDSSLEGRYTFFDRSDDIRTSDIYLFDCEAIIVAGEGSDFIPKYFKGKFDLHQRTYAIMNFKDIRGIFLYYYIYQFRKHFLKYAVGSTVKSLRLPMFEIMDIKYPQKDEQEKIGNYFKNLDSLIKNHKLQLTKLENLKKACLAKMFV